MVGGARPPGLQPFLQVVSSGVTASTLSTGIVSISEGRRGRDYTSTNVLGREEGLVGVN